MDDEFDWKDFLAPYESVVLVGNSGVLLENNLTRFESKRTLYVFFNDARRSLSLAFNHDCILMLRCGPYGPNVVRSRKMKKTLAVFTPKSLKVIVQFRVAPSEKVIDLGDATGHKRCVVDRVWSTTHPYPEGKIPTSGFAAIDWLMDVGFSGQIVAAGFSGVRSTRATLYTIHNWHYEQVALRMYERRGLITAFPSLIDGDAMRELLKRRFPDASDTEVNDSALSFLNARQEAGNEMLNTVWGATRNLRAWRSFFKKLKFFFK